LTDKISDDRNATNYTITNVIYKDKNVVRLNNWCRGRKSECTRYESYV